VLPNRGLYEVAIRVKDLSKSEAFYREILGLEVGIRDERRNMLFLRAGGQAGMVVLRRSILPSRSKKRTSRRQRRPSRSAVLMSRGPCSTSGCPRDPSTSPTRTAMTWSSALR